MCAVHALSAWASSKHPNLHTQMSMTLLPPSMTNQPFHGLGPTRMVSSPAHGIDSDYVVKIVLSKNRRRRRKEVLVQLEQKISVAVENGARAKASSFRPRALSFLSAEGEGRPVALPPLLDWSVPGLMV
eukprot:scaffold13002_cov125-Isochrysis_galbana.AAC.10